MTHNMFRTVHGSRRTPVQKVLGQDRQPLVMSMIASTVFAEVPESVAAPAGSRFIPAAYLGPSYSSRASFVSGLVGPIGQQEVNVFQAKSIRVLNKIVFNPELCPTLIRQIGSREMRSEPESVVDLRPLPQPMPSSGPPVLWLRDHGRTPGWYALISPGRVHMADSWSA